ncbi:Rhodanese-related sulfurtransferase [Lutibacter oricola]|uniref:Rhodanese-related sulfurtransferase n=1 Tax=Lutibacter oricola TaxID=762486 RepID=A0A1H3CF62_9FLAO|nr:rhodanese-like domain-containing protein [Lutibacter oricola]SDX52832.1 Rhodanese-related sulfurtransferase [Lutibacter oricola]
MRKLSVYSVLFFVILTIFSSFKNNESETTNPPSEFELLVKHLEENGNFINSTLSPALIDATQLKEELKNKTNLVLDIRSESWFEYGHIKKAVNIKAVDILDYFESKIKPEDYTKITIVCYSGQSAAYYTSLLRLLGYNNVYSLKWGMSSWHEDFAANSWVKNTKENLLDNLETTENPIPEKTTYPTINTGKTVATEILKERVKAAFLKPYKEFVVKAPIAIENSSDYHIINYMSKDTYNAGHLKGAILYEPNKSLATTTNLATLPTNSKVLINCNTGLDAAYAVAYLHILGYDIYNLAYGSNGYMNKIMLENHWNGFSTKEIKNFPVVE